MLGRFQQALKAYDGKSAFCNYAPLHVYIEPTNKCNLHCFHCTSGRSDGRAKGFMDFDLYQNIVGQCGDLGVEWIYLFFIGEPLLHPDIDRMISFARDHGIKVRLHTNGTISKVTSIVVDSLHISINSTDFIHIQRNIDRLIELDRSFVLESIDGISPPVESRYAGYVSRKKYLNFYLEQKDGESQVVCSHPYKSMAIGWDGRCSACCVDAEIRFPVGKLPEESLLEVWNGPRMQEIRSHPVDICRGCNIRRVP